MPAGEYETTESALATASTVAPVPEDTHGDTPNVTTAAYERSLKRWRKCRDLMKGLEAIRAGGTLYLPAHPNEGTVRYEVRRNIAGLFNAYKRTVLTAVGVLTQQEPALSEDMPQKLVDWWEDADFNGTHGTVLTKKLITAAIVDGYAGILTEYPRPDDKRLDFSKASLAARIAVQEGKDLDEADEEALGLRPYFILVKADEVLMAVYESVNGKKTLVQLILRNTVSQRQGRFGLKTVTQYRVYETQRASETVTYELWQGDAAGKPARTEGPTIMRNIKEIPWSPMPVGEEVSPGEFIPPLLDLADLNIEHHNIKTNILSLESLACVPTPVRIGARKNEDGEYPTLVLGPSNTIEAPATPGVNTPIYWLSPDISVLEPARKSLESCVEEMGAMGVNFLVPQPRQPETATAHELDANAENASTSTVGRAAQDCLELAFMHAAAYIKVTAGSVKINKDFENARLTPEEMTAWATVCAQTGFPIRLLLAAFQEGGRISEDEDLDALEMEMMMNVEAQNEAKRLAAEANKPTDPNAPADEDEDDEDEEE